MDSKHVYMCAWSIATNCVSHAVRKIVVLEV
jgi:hypothetical protein